MATIERLKGISRESDAFMAVMDLLEGDPAAMKVIVNKSADMILGGGARSAVTVVEPEVLKWILRKRDEVTDKVVGEIPDLIFARGDPKFYRKLAKIVAIGMVKGMIEDHRAYLKYMEPSFAEEFEQISVERGRQKFREMLEHRGIRDASKENNMSTIIAKQLVSLAREIVGATKDLGEIMAILPELRKKQEELSRIQEEQQREWNRKYGEATHDVEMKTTELLKVIQKEIEDYFKGNGMGIRSSDVSGGLCEVFIGSEDGVKRYQSKVSVHIALLVGRYRASYKIRNETLDDKDAPLAEKLTIPKLMQSIKKADKSGFWAYAEE